MNKNEIWNEMEKTLDSENIKFNDLFNYFSSSDLKEFLEFLKEEYKQ